MVNNKLFLGLFWSIMVIKSVFHSIVSGHSKCEVGKYGRNCEHQCHCLQNVLCNNGFCEGLCERGYTNIPYCNKRCPAQKFGLNCVSDCHCFLGEECDKVNGDCPNKACSHQYDGAACQRRLPRLVKPPTIMTISCLNVTLGWAAFIKDFDVGEGPVGQYIVKTKTRESMSWDNPINVTDKQDGAHYYSATFSEGLVPEAYHLFRIDVRATAHGKLIGKAQDGLPSFPVLHTCLKNSASGLRSTTNVYVLPTQLCLLSTHILTSVSVTIFVHYFLLMTM